MLRRGAPRRLAAASLTGFRSSGNLLSKNLADSAASELPERPSLTAKRCLPSREDWETSANMIKSPNENSPQGRKPLRWSPSIHTISIFREQICAREPTGPVGIILGPCRATVIVELPSLAKGSRLPSSMTPVAETATFVPTGSPKESGG